MKKIELSSYDKVHIETYGDRIEKIIDITCKFYNVSRDAMAAHRKIKIPMRARHLIMLMCRDIMPGCPLYIIGYFVNPEYPFDHNSVKHAIENARGSLYQKTATGRYANDELRNEYQVLRGNVLYELGKIGVAKDKTYVCNVHAWVGKDVYDKMHCHAQSTGISKSMFIRNAIVNELNRLSNGI